MALLCPHLFTDLLHSWPVGIYFSFLASIFSLNLFSPLSFLLCLLSALFWALLIRASFSLLPSLKASLHRCCLLSSPILVPTVFIFSTSVSPSSISSLFFTFALCCVFSPCLPFFCHSTPPYFTCVPWFVLCILLSFTDSFEDGCSWPQTRKFFLTVFSSHTLSFSVSHSLSLSVSRTHSLSLRFNKQGRVSKHDLSQHVLYLVSSPLFSLSVPFLSSHVPISSLSPLCLHFLPL